MGFFSTNQIIVKEMTGLITLAIFKKLNQHFLLAVGWVKEEQKEESKRHIYNKCRCMNSMSTNDECF